MSDSGPVPELWVRQIAEEVLRRLGEKDGATPGSAVPASAASGAARSASPCAGCPNQGCCPTRSAEPTTGAVCAMAENAGDHYNLLLEHGVERVTCCPHIASLDRRLAGLIDHTILKPEATDREIAQLCEEAHCHAFATVCIQPIWVPLAVRLLEGTKVRVCTVVGFPHGANREEVKAYETRLAVGQGAREIDMVIPVGALKSGDLRTVARHVRGVVHAAIPGITTKVILETAFLTKEEKVAACRIARDEGATFVKTSTGFGPSGASLDDVRLMRETVGPRMGVKAAGGIRDRETAVKMVEAGATRIGASASIRITTGSAA
jgi:deoxyribose-phosphate aldolase